MKNLPKFAQLNLPQGPAGTAVRLDGNTYVRDHGHWQVGYKIEGDKILTVSETEHLNGVELVEITETDWAKDNKKVPESD